jgi:hypothetical protein
MNTSAQAGRFMARKATRAAARRPERPSAPARGQLEDDDLAF